MFDFNQILMYNSNDKEMVISLKEETEKFSIKGFIKKHSVIPYLFIAIPIFILALMLTAQVKTVNITTEFTQDKRETELIDDLVTLQRLYDDLELKYEQSEKIVTEYKSNTTTNSELIASMEEEIKKLSIYSGTTDLTGPGIIITLDDGDKALEPELRSDSIVHDSDILTVVNELKAAGAEAISVNGQRITSMSAIRCVGPIIQINYQTIAAPFVIHAIGNAQYLESAINIKNGVADLLKSIGVQVEVRREDEVYVPKFSGILNIENSTIINE